MARRSKYAVHFYLEDGFLVRGTLDPVIALGLAVGEDYQFEETYWAASDGRRPEDPTEGDPTPENISDLAGLCHHLIRDARPGLYRINPAPRDSEYTWFASRVTKRGPGVFEAVSFR